MPFAWSLLAHFGFYNFLFSVPLALLAVALWWRWRDALLVRLPDARSAPLVRLPDAHSARWRRVVALEALLLVTYFAHLVALAMALGAIALLWLLDCGRARWRGMELRRWLLHPLLLAPQLVLPLWYLHTHASGPIPNDWPLSQRLRFLGELQALFAFRDDAPHLPGIALALLLLALAVATLLCERPRSLRRHAFLVLALLAAGVYLGAPGGVGEGVVIQPRLSLFPGLFLLAGITTRLGKRTQAVVAAMATLLLAWEMVALTRWHRDVAHDVDAYLGGLAAVPARTRVLPMVWNRYASLENAMLGHASGFVLAPKGAVDWDDYQASADHFALRFLPWLQMPKHIETDVDNYRAGEYVGLVDFVYTWQMPPTSPTRTRLRYFYRPVSGGGDGRLWQRRSGMPAAPP